MTRLRVTLTFEKVKVNGDVIEAESHGAFVNQPDANQLAMIVSNTVLQNFDRFMEGEKAE